MKTNTTLIHEPTTNNQILFEKSCSPTALLKVISLDNVNTSNIIKLHHLQQEKELIQSNHSIINLDSNSIINHKFSDGGVLINQTTPTTPVILTNFGTINSFQQQQPATTLQPFNQQSTLFSQIDSANSTNFMPLVQQTSMQPPQQAFQNLSVYCAASEPTHQQQLHEKQQLQAEQLSIQAKMVKELQYLTNNVITSTPMSLPTNTLNRGEIAPKTDTNKADTNLSVSQRNLQAMLDAICHLEGAHSVVTSSPNDLMVR